PAAESYPAARSRVPGSARRVGQEPEEAREPELGRVDELALLVDLGAEEPPLDHAAVHDDAAGAGVPRPARTRRERPAAGRDGPVEGDVQDRAGRRVEAD